MSSPPNSSAFLLRPPHTIRGVLACLLRFFLYTHLPAFIAGRHDSRFVAPFVLFHDGLLQYPCERHGSGRVAPALQQILARRHLPGRNVDHGSVKERVKAAVAIPGLILLLPEEEARPLGHQSPLAGDRLCLALDK